MVVRSWWMSTHVPISVCPEPSDHVCPSSRRGNREEADSVQERKQVLEDAHLLPGADWAPLSPLGLSPAAVRLFTDFPCVFFREVLVTCIYWRTRWRPLLKWRRRRTWASESLLRLMVFVCLFTDCLLVNTDRWTEALMFIYEKRQQMRMKIDDKPSTSSSLLIQLSHIFHQN